MLSYLDDQAHAPGHSAAAASASASAAAFTGEEGSTVAGRERGRERRRHKHSRENSTGGLRSGSLEQKTSVGGGGGMDDKRKRSREYAKPEDIRLSPVPRRDPFTGRVEVARIIIIIFGIVSISY